MKKIFAVLALSTMLFTTSTSVFAAISPDAHQDVNKDVSPKTGESAALPMAITATAAGLVVCLAKSRKDA